MGAIPIGTTEITALTEGKYGGFIKAMGVKICIPRCDSYWEF